MTRDDIIRMAREAGLINSYGGRECASDEMLAHFAALARAAGEQAEREACAKVCDEQHDRARTPPGAARADACARAIRARGEKK